MEIVHNDDDLRVYMATAVKEISHDAPILVDKYIRRKRMEIDAICDGEHVYIPGIMEHIERAGIHSGDSISVYPPQTISDKVRDTIVDYSIRIGKGFHFIGLFNIQFIVEAPKGKRGNGICSGGQSAKLPYRTILKQNHRSGNESYRNTLCSR